MSQSNSKWTGNHGWPLSICPRNWNYHSPFVEQPSLVHPQIHQSLHILWSECFLRKKNIYSKITYGYFIKSSIYKEVSFHRKKKSSKYADSLFLKLSFAWLKKVHSDCNLLRVDNLIISVTRLLQQVPSARKSTPPKNDYRLKVFHIIFVKFDGKDLVNLHISLPWLRLLALQCTLQLFSFQRSQ